MDSTPARGRRRGPIALLLDLIDNWVTPRADARAREMGFEITRIPGTRIQSYRLPIWDRRRECELCAGSGLVGARVCGPCDGTGVGTLDAAPEAGEPR